MRIVFIGSVEFSFKMLNHLLLLFPNSNDMQIVGIITKNSSEFNADFCSLESLAVLNGIPCFCFERNNEHEMAGWLKALAPDVIYCFGWSHLIKPEILSIPHIGVIGYHPAALPENRGRHPVIWALALGLTKTASTFFFIDSGVDSGDILSQVFLSIEPEDNARTLYDKLISSAKKQIAEFTPMLKNGDYLKVPQDHSKANYWRKRTVKDGLIDWRMSADSVHNLVRALTRPYVGAHFVFRKKEVKIWKTEIMDYDVNNIEPGKVLRVEPSGFSIKCGKGVLKVIEHDFMSFPGEGEYI